jgi:hypothetical protein
LTQKQSKNQRTLARLSGRVRILRGPPKN